MPSHDPSHQEFTLLPLSFPTDAQNITHLHYQAMVSTLPPGTTAPEESSFNKINLPLIITRFSHPSSLGYKLVLSSLPNTIVGYIYFVPPSSSSTRTTQEQERDLREEVAKSSSPTDKTLLFQLKSENAALNEKYFGAGYKQRFWELEALVVDQDFQRRGLGTRLVREGMREVERRCKEGGKGDMGKGEGRKAEGVFLVANPAGRRTYENSGFELLGGRPQRREGMRDDHMHLWFLKRFD